MAGSDIDLSKLNANNIGNWPIPVKAVVVVLVCVAIGGGAYWYDTQNQIEDLERLKRSELDLRRDFETKQRQANILPKLKEQLEEIKKSFGELLRRLPSQTEVPALLVDISQTGLASGLTFKRFEPGGERPREFIRELPIQLTLVGTYHDLGKFVSGIAALPRIVTQHNITLKPNGDGTLTMTEIAQTYRYQEEGS